MNFPEPMRPGLSPLLVRLKTDVLTYEQDAKKNSYDAHATVVVRVRDGEGRVVHKMSQQYQLTGRLHELRRPSRARSCSSGRPSCPPGSTPSNRWSSTPSAPAPARACRRSKCRARTRRLQVSSVVCVNRVERVTAEAKDPTNPLYVDDMLLYPNGGEPFSRTGQKELTFFYTVYPATGDAQLTANVELQRNGKVLVKLPVELGKPDGQGRIQQVGRLPLAPLTPGTYQLHVVISDGGSTLERTAYFQVAS